MLLSWNEVRARAAPFAEDWRDAAYAKGEIQSFYNAFFDIFGVRRRSVARYEEHVRWLDNRSGFIDLFWPGVLIVEQISAGRDLAAGYGQAGDYFDSLSERDRPRYILVREKVRGRCCITGITLPRYLFPTDQKGEADGFPSTSAHSQAAAPWFVHKTRLNRCTKQLP